MLKYLFGLFKRFNKNKYSKLFNKKEIILPLDKEPEDARDFIVTKALPVNAEDFYMPSDYSLKDYATRVKNQGRIGSCTGFALTGAYEILRNKQYNEVIDTSELFSYYQARKAQGWEQQDSGAYIRDIMKSAKKDGIALEHFWKYDTNKWNIKPPFAAYFGAKFLRIKGYYRCYSPDDVKKALLMDYPVVFGIKIFSNFFNYKQGVYKSTSGSYGGGHAMCIIGYDDDKQAFLVRNSWGRGWGLSGYCWLHYDMFRKLLLDAWAMKLK